VWGEQQVISDTPFRKAWQRSVIDRIEVGDDAALEQIIAAGETTPLGFAVL